MGILGMWGGHTLGALGLSRSPFLGDSGDPLVALPWRGGVHGAVQPPLAWEFGERAS